MAKVALPVNSATKRPLRKMGGTGATFGTATFGVSTFGGTAEQYAKQPLTTRIT